MREEAEILHSTLKEITQAVKQDADNTSKLLGSPGGDIEVVDAGLLEGAEDDFLSKRPISPSRAARLRSSSPTRSRSPAVSDNVLATVHSAIQKKNIQVMVSSEHVHIVHSYHRVQYKNLLDKLFNSQKCQTSKFKKNPKFMFVKC